MGVRARAGLGLLLVVAGVGCTKAAETVVGASSAKVSEVKDTRIRERAPGTWVCRSHSPRPAESGPGTSLEVGEDRLTVTVLADGRYGYVKYGHDERVEYDGDGTWSLVDGTLELRTSYEDRNDKGYRLTGVHDEATELLFERIEYRTNGSRISEDDAVPFPISVPDDDHIVFDVGRGYLWACARDASEPPVEVPGSVPPKAPKKVGELIGEVKVSGGAAGDRPPTIEILEPGSSSLGYVPDLRDDGTFSLELPPGDYTVGKQERFARDDPTTCVTVDVTIEEGATARVTIECTR